MEEEESRECSSSMHVSVTGRRRRCIGVQVEVEAREASEVSCDDLVGSKWKVHSGDYLCDGRAPARYSGADCDYSRLCVCEVWSNYHAKHARVSSSMGNLCIRCEFIEGPVVVYLPLPLRPARRVCGRILGNYPKRLF